MFLGRYVLRLPEAEDSYTPLHGILAQIEELFKCGFYYPALVVALTLPEICAGMELDAGRNVTRVEYVAWCETYVDARTAGLSAEDCYRLRGGIVHKGTTGGHRYAPWGRVAFTTPQSGVRHHGYQIQKVGGPKGTKMLDLVTFYGALRDAVRKWYSVQQGNPTVRKNMPNVISLRPDGCPPDIVGLSVIA